MEKIKAFVKKYWFWILVVLFIVLAVITIILLSRREEEQEVEVEIRRIESPYFPLGYEVDVVLDSTVEGFQAKEPVLEISRPETFVLQRMIRHLVTEGIEVDTSQDFSHTTAEGITISYNADYLKLLIYGEEGKTLLNEPLFSQSDVENFFLESLGITGRNDSVQELEQGYTLYEGYLELEGIGVGSIALDGYGYKLRISRSGRISDIEVLVLSADSVVDFQYMPSIPLEELTKTGKYPKEVHHRTISEALYKRPPFLVGSIQLRTFTTKEVQNIYLFNSLETPYIYPTYKLSGEGVVEDLRGDTYWSTTDIYICAVSPDYLYEREAPNLPSSADPYMGE